jgi:hypothetical protein
MKAINISNLAKGKAPISRYDHQSISMSSGKYLVIMGGRNN